MHNQKLVFFIQIKKEKKNAFSRRRNFCRISFPADDFKELRISIDQEVVRNEESTFYARVSGESMQGAGLDNGDLLVIDRSLEPQNDKIAVCFIDGAFTVKRLKVEVNCVYLMPENKNYEPIKVSPEDELFIWGIVTYVVKKV